MNTSKSPRHNRRAVVLLGAVLALLVVFAAVLLNQNSAPSSADPHDPDPTHSPAHSHSPSATPSAPSPSPTMPATPAPPVGTTGAIDDDMAGALIDTYLSTAVALDPDTADVSAWLDAVAGDIAIAELEAELLELDSNGWTRTGAPAVVSASVVDQDSDASPPEATVHACVDSSDVQILDSTGSPLPADPSSARALNIYTLHQVDDSWVIAARTFADEPAC